jgi:predicted transcriptional regulator
MTRKEFVLRLINNAGHNIKTFSDASGIPYTTVYNALKRNMENTGLTNSKKIAQALGITLDDLASVNMELVNHVPEIWTEEERKSIEQYKKLLKAK